MAMLNWQRCVGILVLIPLVNALGTTQLYGQTTVFQTGFEFLGDEPTGLDIDNNMANLNGADDQIGTLSGILPIGAGQFEPSLVGFRDHPGPNNNSRVLQIDRPNADGSFFADFTEPIFTDGATVSFEVGTRRTNGSNEDNHAKDYDIIGKDSDGNESFHVRISANSDEVGGIGRQERVAILTDNGATVTYDLPTVLGEDRDEDMESISNVRDPGEIALITLNLQGGGYVLDFMNFIPEDGPRPANAYTTDLLSYNGTATQLSQIEFTFQGGDSNSLRGGYVVDNIFAAGNLVSSGLPLDLNNDGSIDAATPASSLLTGAKRVKVTSITTASLTPQMPAHYLKHGRATVAQRKPCQNRRLLPSTSRSHFS